MRLLFVVPYTPNLIRVRPYNLIRSLSKRGHKVTLLALSGNDSERADADALREFCHRVVTLPLPRWRSLWNCLISLPTRKPLQAVYCWHPTLAEHLEWLVNGKGPTHFDVVHVEHLRGVGYGLHLKELAEHGSYRAPIVWDSVDCISSLFEQASMHSRSRFGRWVSRLELSRTRRYEAWLLSQFSRVLVTSPNDKRALVNLLPSCDNKPAVTVLPNGVDLDFFVPDRNCARDPATIVVSGKMSYHANVTMALHLVQEVMPHVWAKRPDARLTIVGKDPPREIWGLAGAPTVSVTGTVPDIRPYLQRATLAVAPLTYGAGIQNKVLEAMACGTPVIVTPHAASALSAVPGRDLVVANDEAVFAQEVVSLLSDPLRRHSLGAHGRTYVEQQHSWDTVAAHLEEIYASVIGE